MNYDREVADVKADSSSALIRLTESGARVIYCYSHCPMQLRRRSSNTLPNKRSLKVRGKILEFNQFIKAQAEYYQSGEKTWCFLMQVHCLLALPRIQSNMVFETRVTPALISIEAQLQTTYKAIA